MGAYRNSLQCPFQLASFWRPARRWPRPAVFVTGFLCALLPSVAFAQSAPTPTEPTIAPPPDRYEDDWVGWNTGGDDASFGFAVIPG